MEAFDFDDIVTGEQAVRVVRALGGHRYVLGRCHEVHAFAVDAARPCLPPNAEIVLWAEKVLEDKSVDKLSRDPRLVRRATDSELVTVLSAFWAPSAHTEEVHDKLSDHLQFFEQSELPPFDDDAEENMFPVLIDAGWELLPLALLDEERHKGVIESFGDRLAFEAARFVEEDSVPPKTYLMELPPLGQSELLYAVDEDLDLVAPLCVWADVPPSYLDYVLRGVTRAALKTP
jgi:hypothetical protein